jgi:hypothetical protein
MLRKGLDIGRKDQFRMLQNFVVHTGRTQCSCSREVQEAVMATRIVGPDEEMHAYTVLGVFYWRSVCGF